MSAEGRAQLARYAGIFASGTMLSRVLGLVRDMVLGALVPAAGRDAFFMAFQLPNMLRDMLGEGAANAALVPVFTRRREQDGDEAFRGSVRAVLGMFLIMFAWITILGVVLMPLVPSAVELLRQWSGGHGRADDNWPDTVALMRWTFPYLFFIGLTAFATAPLFILRHYSTPSWSPVLLNVALILSCWTLRSWFPSPVWALVAGVWAGGIAQMAVMFWALRRVAGIWLPRLHPGHPDVARVFLLLGPVILGQTAGEINKLVDKFFAYALQTDVVTALYYSNRLVQLPLAMFGVAVSAAVLPSLSAAVVRDEHDRARDTLAFGLRFSFLLTAPALAGLLALGGPLVQLLFERGEFTASTTDMTARALYYYALGLVAFTWIKVAAQAFYARQDTTTPVAIAAACMLLNIALNFALVRPMGYEGLALATSISFGANALMLLAVLGRRFGNPFDAASMLEMGKTLVASVAAGGAAWGVHAALATALGADAFYAQAGATLPAVAASIAVFCGLCLLFRVRDFGRVLASMRR